IVDEVTAQGAGMVPPRPKAAAPAAPTVASAVAAPAPVAVAPYVAPPVAAPSTPPPAEKSGNTGGNLAGPPVLCPQCDHPNPANNKFCASCGFKLTRPAAVASEPAPPPAPAGAASSSIIL